MKIALISDIHGNAISLQAAVSDIDQHNVDRIICLGDIAATGPQPRQCVEILQEHRIPVVLGNADAWMIDPKLSESPTDFIRFVEEVDLWCIDEIGAEGVAFLQTFQPRIKHQFDERMELLCFHGSPHSYNDVLTATTPDEELAPFLTGFETAIMAGGHTHQQLLRRYRDIILLNPGSVGLGYERNRTTDEAHNVGWAEYALLEYAAGQLSIDLRRVPVDVQAIVDSAFASGMPHAEEWTSHWV